MNLSINSGMAVSRPAFQAKRGIKPTAEDLFFTKRDTFFNTEGSSAKTLAAKIKYKQKRLAAEEEYLREVTSIAEKRYVESTIMRMRFEIEDFKRALIKVLSKKV